MAFPISAQWALPVRLRKSREVNTRELTIESILSAPYPDLAGDIVEPSGIDFAPHSANADIDLEHGRHPGVKSLPVAWARPSLRKAGPYHQPQMLALDFGTDDKPDVHTVPVGKEWFDPNDPLSMQVFALCEQDALPGRSLEFSPRPGFMKAIGRSPLERRSAYRFAKADVHRWTVCEQPVCQQARTVTKSLTQVPRPDAILKALTDKRVRVGGLWEPLHPHLMKALGPVPKRTTVRVEKAMDDEAMGAEMEPAIEAETDGPEDTGPPAKPTVQAHYDVSQGLLDLVDQAETALQSSEHVKGRAFLGKKLEMIRALAEDIKGMGDKIDGELGGQAGDDEEPDGDEYEPEEVDMSTDDDGVLKAVRPVYRKSMKRFTLAEIREAQAAAARPQPISESPEFKAAWADFRKWKRLAGK